MINWSPAALRAMVLVNLREAQKALGQDLVGRRFRFVEAPTRTFKVIAATGGMDVWVRDGREERKVPLALLRAALAAGGLEEAGESLPER